MRHKSSHRVLAGLLCSSMIVTTLPTLSVSASTNLGDPILYWNTVVLDVVAHDANETYGTAQMNNPGATSRALGMVHASMYDAVNSIIRSHEPYLTLIPVDTGTGAIDSAVAYAAHGVLLDMYSNQADVINDALVTHMADVPDSPEKELGKIVGRMVADAMLTARTGDGADIDGTYTAGDQPGDHRVDPLNPDQSYWGPTWGEVTPFTLTSGSQFRAPAPPAITSQEYADAYNEVKELGGDGVITNTSRTADQTEAGIFWAYDGAPMLGTPPRFYNQIARVIIEDQGGNSVVENARLLALMNLAIADAGIAAWDSKFHYNYWRPVVGIREADVGTGPSGLGDGNPDTVGDPTWTPLNSPASNNSGTDFTPPFPTYPSGHATFGAAAFRMIANYYGTDDIAFTVTSDELNGVTTDTDGNVRPHSPRSFTSLSKAAEENGMSRVYLGIHWNFDSSSGIDMGNAIADYTFDNYLQATSLPVDPCENGCISTNDYDLTTTVSAPASVEQGSSFTTDISVSNSGPGTATGASITMDIPAELELNTVLSGSCGTQSGQLLCDNITVASNATTDITIEWTASSAVSCPITTSLQATVDSSNDYLSSNNTSNEEVITIECEPENDLRVELSGEQEVHLGDTITYTLIAYNEGPATASTPELQLNLPAGVSFASSNSSSECAQVGSSITCDLSPLAAHEQQSVTVSFNPLQSLSCGTELTVQASIDSSELELNSSDNTSSSLQTELTCSLSSSSSSASTTGTTPDQSHNDNTTNYQSPGARRGSGTNEARTALSMLTMHYGLSSQMDYGGHYLMSKVSPVQFGRVGSEQTVSVGQFTFTASQQAILCSMQKFMEYRLEQREIPKFRDWLPTEIADTLHLPEHAVRQAMLSTELCQ